MITNNVVLNEMKDLTRNKISREVLRFAQDDISVRKMMLILLLEIAIEQTLEASAMASLVLSHLMN